MPRASKSVVMRTLVLPLRNSFIISSLSFCSMSPCTRDTVKSRDVIFSNSQSTLGVCHTEFDAEKRC